MNNPLNVAIVGCGAMATLFASRLVNTDVNVTLIGTWRKQIYTLQQKGLIVINLYGGESHYRIKATETPAEIAPVDVALILVKSYQTDRAVKQAAQILSPDGLAMTLQNGLGNFEKLVEAVGQHRAVAGVTSQAATLEAPGVVRQAGEGPTFLAVRPEIKEQLNPLVELMNEAGLHTNLVNDVQSLVWGKLAINAAINPLTALLEIANGKILENKNLLKIMRAAINEVVRMAAAQNIQLAFEDPFKPAIEVCRATASNHSSMLQDILRGTPTEIDAICGAVVKLGKKLQIATPVNEFFLTEIKAKEKSHKFNPEKLQTVSV